MLYGQAETYHTTPAALLRITEPDRAISLNECCRLADNYRPKKKQPLNLG